MFSTLAILATAFTISLSETANDEALALVETAPAVTLDVPYVPTAHEVVKAMLDLTGVEDGDIVYDLGCGDGRIVIEAARRAAIKGVGIDLDPDRIAESKINAKEAGVEHKVEFMVGDLFETDFSDANVLAMYLLPSVNLRLRPVILEKLAPGTRIVSHAFDMRDWQPDRHERVSANSTHDVYFWVVPANVSGDWKFEGGDESREIQFTQEFQKIEGNVSGGTDLVNAKLNGTALEFDMPMPAGFAKVAGTVSGDIFVGSMTHESVAEPVAFKGSRVANTQSSIIPSTEVP